MCRLVQNLALTLLLLLLLCSMALKKPHSSLTPEPAECHLTDGDEIEISRFFQPIGRIQVWTRARRGPRMLYVKGQEDLLHEARAMARSRIAENKQLKDAGLLPRQVLQQTTKAKPQEKKMPKTAKPQEKAMPKSAQGKANSKEDTPQAASSSGGPVHAIPGTVKRVHWQEDQEVAPRPMGTTHLPVMLSPEEWAGASPASQEWLLNELAEALSKKKKVVQLSCGLQPPPGLGNAQQAQQVPELPPKLQWQKIAFQPTLVNRVQLLQNLLAVEPQQAQPGLQQDLSTSGGSSSASSCAEAARSALAPAAAMLPLSPCSPCTPEGLLLSPCSPCTPEEDRGSRLFKNMLAMGDLPLRTTPQPQMT
jgi:hypothetical protein